MNALGYTRISTAAQSEHSLDHQERMIRQYCVSNGLTLLEIFKDDGECSYTFDRADFKALEAFIKKNKNVDYLIILCEDRFSRNLAEALMKISDLQKKYGLKVLTVTDPIDIDLTDPAVFMMRAFKFMMAEGELHNIRKRTKNGMVEAALKGRFCHVAPYGYLNSRDEHDRPIILIREDRAEIVRAMFREYLSGLELEQVRSAARKRGYNQTGKSSIKRILSNAVYCGLIEVPAHKNRKARYVQGIHAPIVSEQDFWLIQERLGGRRRAVHNREEVPLKGVLHCWCGRRATACNCRSKTGEYHWYYLCNEHRAYLPAKKLHKQFGELLDHLSISPERIGWLKRDIGKKIGAHLQGRGEEMARLEREIKAVDLQIKTTERKYLTRSNISEVTYNEVMAGFQGDRVRLQRELAEINTDQQAYWDRLADLLPRLCNLREAFDRMPIEKQHQFINMGFYNNLYYEGGSYRTQKLHPLLSGNELILKEKKLLVIEQPVIKLAENPKVPQTEFNQNPLSQWAEFLELIA